MGVMEYTKYLIAIPCMDTMPTPFVSSLLNMRRVGATKVSFLSNSLIYDARNMLAREALETEADRILWLDSDMQFTSDLMERLVEDMDSGLDFVSALYFKRRMPTEPCIYKTVEAGTTGKSCVEVYHDYPRDTLFPIAGSGFGAVMCSTDLIADIAKEYGPPFDPVYRLGEDLAFCLRAKRLGYTLYCDSRIKANHIGQIAYGEQHYKRPEEG